MINKDLKDLSRRELVDIIYQMKKNEQQLQEEIAALRSALQDKRIHLTQAGSIADAAVSITQILSAAQNTADLYLQEIACMKAETEKECARMIEDAKQTAANIFSGSDTQYSDLYHLENAEYQPLQSEIQAWEKIIVRELLEGADHGKKN